MTKHFKIARTFAAAALAGSAITLATPAAAELVPFEDYEASDAVYDMVTVDIEPGEFETYLENLRNTWVQGNEIAKRLGHIEDYAIYANTNGAGKDFDLLLVIKFGKTSDLTPSRERYLAFMQEYGEQNQDRDQTVVRDVYNKIRKLTGQYKVREITFKD